MSYVVDTNVINWLVDGRIKPEELPSDADYLATHIQIDELNKTRDEERRACLFLKFAEIRPQVVPTETLVWGTSRWGEAKWGSGVLFNQLKAELDAINNSKTNNVNDVLIAEVAIANGYTLLTADKDLAEVVKNQGGVVHFYGT